MPSSQIDRTAVVAVLIAFLGLLAAYVVLTMTNHDGEGVVRLTITITSILGVGVYTRGHLTRQDVTMAQIEHQTNGVLDERIKSNARAAMQELLTETGVVPVPVTVIPSATVAGVGGPPDDIHNH